MHSGANFLYRFQKFGQIGDISAEHAATDDDAASENDLAGTAFLWIKPLLHCPSAPGGNFLRRFQKFGQIAEIRWNMPLPMPTQLPTALGEIGRISFSVGWNALGGQLFV